MRWDMPDEDPPGVYAFHLSPEGERNEAYRVKRKVFGHACQRAKNRS
jgi:hypothetical protein